MRVVLINLPIQRRVEFTLHRSEKTDRSSMSPQKEIRNLEYRPATHGGPQSAYVLPLPGIPLCMQYISGSEGREHHQAVCSSKCTASTCSLKSCSDLKKTHMYLRQRQRQSTDCLVFTAHITRQATGTERCTLQITHQREILRPGK